MPCTYVINEDQRMVFTTLSGLVTAEEAFNHQNSLASDPIFQPSFNQLIDGTQVVKFNIGPAEVRALAKRNFFAPQSRRAMLVKGTLLYGMARMLVTFRELAGAPEEMNVFTDRSEALLWLTQEKPQQ